MPRVTVVKVNGLRTPEQRAGVVYVGRRFAGWPASPWANPYRVRANARPGQLTHVLYDFGVYARAKPDSWWADLWAACGQGRLPLGCWCFSGPADDGQHLCHAAILGEELNLRFVDLPTPKE